MKGSILASILCMAVFSVNAKSVTFESHEVAAKDEGGTSTKPERNWTNTSEDC